jgi:hypothetical protein
MPTLTAKQKRQDREERLREEGAARARAEMGAASAVNQPRAEQIHAINEAAFANPGAVPAAHGEVLKPQSAGAKVVVACKLGVTAYNLQLSELVDKFEQTMTGGRTIKEAIRVGPVVQLRGTSYPRGTPPAGFPEKPEIVGGAALNFGIDKEFFDAWMYQHRLSPIVKNEMIFGHESADVVRAMARERSALSSNLEPINPAKDAKDPRIPKPSREEVSKIETGTTK